MIAQARIMHLADGGMRVQELRYGVRALVVVSHTDGQGLDTAVQQVTRMRIQASAQVI